ncbi:lamina-associated polypeptide 2, isoforms beta/delta/epsilon/gamma isoform X1 [Oncorhynchus mykiss]|uniref:lamina-associated polypeptide 2, isoforms beta/delta/epsilon/gamma isoform X1 n=1 Tax=Oncorhynchus mykiss TaxID=8022 RepID=UPI001877C410|nr:lamina-associated polypeptide 2, isoforms beta/delta/epsilon/gamma isoform X1 [Oncorhynchus mykiss]
MLKWMTKRCPQTRMCLPLILMVFLVLNLRLSLEKEYQHGNEQMERHSRNNKKAEYHYHQCFMPSSRMEPVTDVLMEFLETESIHTGIVATCRRPIKGAAGRPVQFTYPDLPASPMTLQRQALERCLVTLWAQILVFLILTCLLELIYSAMEHSSAHPFVALLDNLSMGTATEELSLQDDP